MKRLHTKFKETVRRPVKVFLDRAHLHDPVKGFEEKL